jgi:hypothetical protein
MRHYLHTLAMAIPLLLSCCNVCDAEGPSAPADPAVFVMPREFPPFREVMKGAEWDKQFAAALKSLGDLEALSHSSFPSAGSKIHHVDADRPGSQLGLVAGDVIVEVDGEAIYQKDMNSFRQDHDQQLTVVNAAGVSRQVAIHAGKLGIAMRPMLRPELVYLREGVRNPKWDAYAAVGAAMCRSNPVVAETAWYHAMKLGYAADAISDYCGAHAAWRAGQMEEALARAAVLQSLPKIPAALDAEDLGYGLAVANFKMEQALARQLTAMPGAARGDADFVDRFQNLINAYHQRPAAERVGPAPSEIAAYVKKSLLKEMDPLLQNDKVDDDYANWLRDEMARDRWVNTEAESGHFASNMQIPRGEARDVELAVDINLRRFDDQDSRYARVLTVALVNCDEAEFTARGLYPGGQRMLDVRVEENGTCTIAVGSRDGFRAQRLSVDEAIAGNRRFRLRLLHAAGRDEVWIDRRRLLYLPSTENPKKIGFHFGAVGVKADLHMSFYKLDPGQVEGK